MEVETVGDKVEQEAVFGTVEAVKTVSDLFMPVSGEVLELNPKLDGNPELVNKDPYGEGWMVKIRPSDLAQVKALLTADEYAALAGA